MAEVKMVRRLVNPGKRRKLSPLQKLFFGSKRQRAAVKRNAGPKSLRRTIKAQTKSMKAEGGWSKAGARARKSYTRAMHSYLGEQQHSRRKRGLKTKRMKSVKRNISSIVTVYPNPGRRKRNAGKFSIRKTKKDLKKGGMKFVSPFGRSSGYRKRTRKFRNRGKKIVVINKGAKRMARKRSYKRRNPYYRGTMKRVGRKYSKATKGVYVYSNPGRRHHHSRRRSVSHRRRHYRRNPGFLSGGGGTFTKVLGVVGGVAVTKLLVGFLPATFSTGIIGYASIAAVAVLQGKGIGKITKNSALGTDMMIGGLAYLTAKILNDFIPSIGHYTGISGMGMIGPSSFYTPQVNQNGSMGSFVVPAAVQGAIPAPVAPANAGVGRLRRMGRVM